MFLNESQIPVVRRRVTKRNFSAVQLGCESLLIISIFIQTHLQ